MNLQNELNLNGRKKKSKNRFPLPFGHFRLISFHFAYCIDLFSQIPGHAEKIMKPASDSYETTLVCFSQEKWISAIEITSRKA